MPAQTLPATTPAVTAELLGRIAPSESLLRTIQAGGWTTPVELATIAGRAANNIKRDLERLETAGLVDLAAGKDKPVLTADAVAGLAAIDGLANPVRGATGHAAAEPAPGEDFSAIFAHVDFTPNPDQPRKRFNPEAVSQRRASIVRDGLLQNLLARPNPDTAPGAPALQIVSGETRWRAIGEAIALGELPADFPVKTDVRHLTDEQVLAIGLVENMQRSDLSPLEEARAFAELVSKHGRTTAEIAETVSKTQRFVQIRLSLLTLSAEDQAKLESEEINFKEALRILASRPKPLDLTPVKAMILAEVVAAGAGDQAGAYHRKAECAPNAADDAIAAALVSAGLLTIEGPDHFTGRFFARLPDYAVFDRFIGQYPGIAAADRSSALLAIRAAALGADEAERLDSEGAYAAAWLNGPFPLTAEGEAIVEARRQEQASQAVKTAQSDAARELQMKRLSEAHTRTGDLLAAMAKPRVIGQVEGLADIVEAVGHRLPWTFCERRSDGLPGLVDADGAAVHLVPDMGPVAHIALMLVMAAMNAAAGYAPAVVKAEAQQAGDAEEEDQEEERLCTSCSQVFDTATEEPLCPACTSERQALGEA